MRNGFPGPSCHPRFDLPNSANRKRNCPLPWTRRPHFKPEAGDAWDRGEWPLSATCLLPGCKPELESRTPDLGWRCLDRAQPVAAIRPIRLPPLLSRCRRDFLSRLGQGSVTLDTAWCDIHHDGRPWAAWQRAMAITAAGSRWTHQQPGHVRAWQTGFWGDLGLWCGRC